MWFPYLIVCVLRFRGVFWLELVRQEKKKMMVRQDRSSVKRSPEMRTREAEEAKDTTVMVTWRRCETEINWQESKLVITSEGEERKNRQKFNHLPPVKHCLVSSACVLIECLSSKRLTQTVDKRVSYSSRVHFSSSSSSSSLVLMSWTDSSATSSHLTLTWDTTVLARKRLSTFS